MFLPVKADFHLPRTPVLTMVVCAICFGVFMVQLSNWKSFDKAVERYCYQDRSRLQEMVFTRIEEMQDYGHCAELMYNLDTADDTDAVIEDIVTNMRPLVGLEYEDSKIYVRQMLEDELRVWNSIVKDDPNEGLAYYTKSWNPLTMISSSFAHGSWAHILFNLIFFIAFAATVEALIGAGAFAVSILVLSLFIGVMCSVGAYATGNHYTTVGLSGVVTGMMGLFVFLLPHGRIRCYYFFIVIFGSVAVPAWLLAAWYIGGDIYRLFAVEDNGIVNVMAHVSGGLAGYLFGFAFLRKAKVRADSLILG
jgi:membrane associated rhomboid family serine protease